MFSGTNKRDCMYSNRPVSRKQSASYATTTFVALLVALLATSLTACGTEPVPEKRADPGPDAAVSDATTSTCVSWNTTNIGVMTTPGSVVCETESKIHVETTGQDIWGSADSMTYVHQALVGDGSIVARISSLAETDPWAKAGVMIRESLDEDSKHVHMLVSAAATNQLKFDARDVVGGSTGGFDGSVDGAPFWVAVVRKGDDFFGYESQDGKTWTLVGKHTVAMAETTYVGLSLASHGDNPVTKSTFESVSIPAIGLPAIPDPPTGGTPIPCTNGEDVPGSRAGLLSERLGYAQNVTGGSCLHHVTSLSGSGTGSLREALSQSGRWIVFDVNGRITSGGLNVPKDTTIDGRGAEIVIDGTLNITSSNVIVENLAMDNPSGGDLEDLIAVHGSYPDPGPDLVWIDHVTFKRTPDEQLPMWAHKTSTTAPRRVSVTWSHFTNEPSPQTPSLTHALLVGSSPPGFNSEPTNLTLAFNVFETGSRQPLLGDGAKAHMFNNLHAWYVYGPSVRYNGKMLIENAIFDGTKAGSGNAAFSYDAGRLLGDEVMKETGSWMIGNAFGNELNPENVFTVPYQYKLQTPDSTLRTKMENGAGAQPSSAFSF